LRKVVLHRGEDDYWVAECPSLPGCVSQGKTRDVAIQNIREAIRGYIRVLEEDNLPIPPETIEVEIVTV
jgi:predicted RNase H-like HicB family nuclease